mmetsp:Transcript_4752/g.12663  ORF Transcript_4752/g.12663 Transcript_4752/m.12663 type:complete len:132 (+) Transcript_4752:636-1031(+)
MPVRTHTASHATKHDVGRMACVQPFTLAAISGCREAHASARAQNGAGQPASSIHALHYPTRPVGAMGCVWPPMISAASGSACAKTDILDLVVKRAALASAMGSFHTAVPLRVELLCICALPEAAARMLTAR